MVRKEKKISSSSSLQYCTAPLQIWLTNCKTQPCCSDKLQNSALLLRQTAKLSPVAQTNCKTQPGCSDKLQNSALLLRQTAKLSPVAQTNCKTQPGCSDKLQNSARLLRQTAKLSPVAQTNCKNQPGCSDKLQNSARLLRQTAKLRGCMGDVNAVSCHPALCRPRASTFQNKSFTELLLFKVKAQVWNKILFVKKISL